MVSIEKYASLLEREETIDTLLQEKDLEGRDSLDLLAKFDFY